MQCVDQEHHLVALLKAAVYCNAPIQVTFLCLSRKRKRFLDHVTDFHLLNLFLLSTDIKITRPRFSGLDEFGYTSYMAYPPIYSMSHFYEFRLKLTFSNNSTTMKNNLILFSGQKGQGERNCNTYTNTHGKLISVHVYKLFLSCM